jgi:hypothetical protein
MRCTRRAAHQHRAHDHASVSTTPPSTRNAAPVVAEAGAPDGAPNNNFAQCGILWCF